MKLKPEQLKEFIDDLDRVIRIHRDVIESDPRISRPVHETEAAAQTKYAHLSELPPVDGSTL